MDGMLLVVGALVVALLIGLAMMGTRGRGDAGPDEPWPYVLKRPLSRPEQVLFHRLVAALPQHLVLAQVQVSRVLGVKKGANVQTWQNRINRLSFDFVVCGPDASVLAAIELDDASHEAPARVEADRRKSRAAADAGLRLIRWTVRELPAEDEIRAALLAAPPAATPPPPRRGPGGRPGAGRS